MGKFDLVPSSSKRLTIDQRTDMVYRRGMFTGISVLGFMVAMVLSLIGIIGGGLPLLFFIAAAGGGVATRRAYLGGSSKHRKQLGR